MADDIPGFKLLKGADALSATQLGLLHQLIGSETDLLVTDVAGDVIRGYVRLSHRPTGAGLCEIWLDAFSDGVSILDQVVSEFDAVGRKKALIVPSQMSIN